jgi:hypothetical protein
MDNEINKKLFKACRAGDLEVVKQCIKEGANLEDLDTRALLSLHETFEKRIALGLAYFNFLFSYSKSDSELGSTPKGRSNIIIDRIRGACENKEPIIENIYFLKQLDEVKSEDTFSYYVDTYKYFTEDHTFKCRELFFYYNGFFFRAGNPILIYRKLKNTFDFIKPHTIKVEYLDRLTLPKPAKSIKISAEYCAEYPTGNTWENTSKGILFIDMDRHQTERRLELLDFKDFSFLNERKGIYKIQNNNGFEISYLIKAKFEGFDIHNGLKNDSSFKQAYCFIKAKNIKIFKINEARYINKDLLNGVLPQTVYICYKRKDGIEAEIQFDGLGSIYMFLSNTKIICLNGGLIRRNYRELIEKYGLINYCAY